MSEPKPVWITDSILLPVNDGRSCTLIVSRRIAAMLTRLQQLANVAARGSAPAVARVDLRTWAVTLETNTAEMKRDAEEQDEDWEHKGALVPSPK